MKYYLTFLLLILTQYSYTQLPFSLGDQQFIAETGTAISSSFSVFNSPATIQIDSSSLGFSIKNYYTIDGLNEYCFSGSTPLNFASIGGGIYYFGDQFYNETLLTIGLSKQITDEIKLGANIIYHSAFAQFAESGSTLYPTLAVEAQLSNQFTLASTMKNPFSQNIKTPYELNLQSLLSIGTNFKASDRLSLQLQADIVEQDGLSIATAMQLKAFKQFSFLLGGRLQPNTYGLGIQFQFDKNTISTGTQYHQQLGFSPGISGQTILK